MRLVTFFATTFAITWSCWYASTTISTPWLHGAVFLLGVFTPGLVALAFSGRAGALAILARLFRWQTSLRWYVFAMGYIFTIKLVVALLHRVFTGAWPRFGDES